MTQLMRVAQCNEHMNKSRKYYAYIHMYMCVSVYVYVCVRLDYFEESRSAKI